jgi:monofunctional glycosyltransferase
MSAKAGRSFAGVGRSFGRFMLLLIVCFLALQVGFVVQIAAMLAIDPPSTTFQRSEAWRIATSPRPLAWQQRWLDYDAISPNVKRAVIAAEDAGFNEHSGVEWDALEKAWERNQRAEAIAERSSERAAEAATRRSRPGADARPARAAKVVGGSTITQQLAKNLFLAGERNFVRKGQELMLAWVMEAVLGKQRILEIYLNSVEWGEGVFGAEAAAQHYFRKPASKLTPYEAARLAVMLPQPKRFEKTPGSGYLSGRASTIVARMRDATLP